MENSKKFVVNFDESIIFEVNLTDDFYSEKYNSFEEAKSELISYWDNVLHDAKKNLHDAKKMKKSSVEKLP